MKKISTIYICSKGRPNSPTVQWLITHEFMDFVVICSPDDDLKEYRKHATTIKADKWANTLYKKKEWIVETYAPKNGWVFIMEDNIIEVTGVLPSVKQSPTKDDFKSRVSPKQLLEVVNFDIQVAEKDGALLVGYASNDNHFFRTNHYRNVGFVWGKMCAHKNAQGFKWDHSQTEMLDYLHTAAVLKHCGRVLINNYFFAKSKRYEGTPGSPVYEK